MMVPTKLSLLFISILAMNSVSTFEVAYLNLFDKTNVILKRLIYEHDNLTYISSIDSQFREIGVNLPPVKDLSTLWINIVKIGEDYHMVEFPISNQAYDLKENLTFLLTTFDADITSNFVKNLRSERRSLQDFENSYVKLIKYSLSVEIIKAIKLKETTLGEDYERNLIEAVEGSVNEYTKDYFRGSVIDKELLKNYLSDKITIIVLDKLEFIRGYLDFKQNAVAALYGFASLIVNGLYDQTVIWSETTVDEVKVIFNAIYHLEKRYKNSNLDLISKFVKENIFTNLDKFNTRFSKLNVMLFSYFNLSFDNDICQMGRNLFLNYIFRNNFDDQRDFYRSYILRKDYKLRLKVSEDREPLLKLDSYESIINTADLLWTVKGCVLSQADFNNLINNINLFDHFDTNYLLYIDQGDRYFNMNTLDQKEFREVYRALYNAILHTSAKLIKRNINPKGFIEDFESFITFAKAKNLFFGKFDININTFYPVFKLINLYHNLEYFTHVDDRFLRFDDPKSYMLEDFVNTLKGIREMLDNWKTYQVNSFSTKVFKLSMLSGTFIKRGVVYAFLNGVKGGSRISSRFQV